MNQKTRWPRRVRLAALLCLMSVALAAREPPAVPESPQVLFQDLFAAVQNARVFGDSKNFADAIPKAPPQAILAAFHADNPRGTPALRRFVENHFTLPGEVATPRLSGHASLAAHIDALWVVLTRDTPRAPPWSSQLPLPEPYVVPGGRFREIYYWDSWFTMLGLAQSGRRDLVVDMVQDFSHLIETYGHVPNGTRTYYLSRSQPPFFFAMVALLSPQEPARSFAQYLPQLEREYAFWMAGSGSLSPSSAQRRVVMMPDGAILNRYWDDRDTPRDEAYAEDVQLARASGRPPGKVFRNVRAAAESGWDFSSRWLEDGHSLTTIHTTEIVPPDLNSLLYGLENAIAAGCRYLRDSTCAQAYADKARRRQTALNRYLWDEQAGAWMDYRWTRKSHVGRVSAATLYPLFAGLASPAQAGRVARTTVAKLLKAGGLVATTLHTGQQWDAPNGWAPLQWVGIDGLRRYGHQELARTIACRWLHTVRREYEASGRLLEKYDVVNLDRKGGGGEYPLQDGFGWTNGVTRRLLALYPSEARSKDCALRSSSPVPDRTASDPGSH